MGTALHKAKLEGSIAEISYSMEFHQETKFFEARVSLLGEEDFLVMARDVSRRKKAELKLAEQESLLRAINDSTSEAITFIDPEGKIQFFNAWSRQLANILYQREVQHGMEYLSIVPEELRPEISPLLAAAMAGETQEEIRLFRDRWWSVRFFPVRDEQEQIIGVSIVARDITDRKVHELQIMKKNEVLAAISWKHSHELRRPLSNILGLTQMLLEHMDDNPLIKAQTVVHLKSATHELDMLIREIIDQAGHTLESLMLSNNLND